MDAERKKRQKRLDALQAARSLPKLSLACVSVAEALLRDLATEVAERSQHEAGGGKRVTCTDEVRNLLEGTLGTTAGDQSTVSAQLFDLLSEEAATSAKCARAAQEVLAPAAAAGAGADVFGLRPKPASAETIVCTNCSMALSANRFAPHLERCMLGKGRASARMARDAMRANVDG